LPSLEPHITEEKFSLVSPGVMFSIYSQQNNIKNGMKRQYKRQVITK